MSKKSEAIIKILKDNPDQKFVTSSDGEVLFFLRSDDILTAIHTTDESFNGMSPEEIYQLVTEPMSI